MQLENSTLRRCKGEPRAWEGRRRFHTALKACHSVQLQYQPLSRSQIYKKVLAASRK
jgi:hypothetical protein